MLKNEGALPLSAGEKVLIIGELAAKPHLQGGGSARVNARNADDIITCLSAEFGTDYVRGFRRDGRADKKLKRQAIERAKSAQKVIFLRDLPSARTPRAPTGRVWKFPSASANCLKDCIKRASAR